VANQADGGAFTRAHLDRDRRQYRNLHDGNRDGGDSETGGSRDGLPGDHAYTVTGYDATTDTVYVRNPWGVVSDAPLATAVHDLGEGRFKMSFADFYSAFDGVVISEQAWRESASPRGPQS
jgi:hypothetical protein